MHPALITLAPNFCGTLTLHLGGILGRGRLLVLPHPQPQWASALYQSRILKLNGLLPLTSPGQGAEGFPTPPPVSNGFCFYLLPQVIGFSLAL